jgi:uncharacterized protein (TIGR02466 family)
MTQPQLEALTAFPTMIYSVEKPEFVEQVRTVSLDMLKDAQPANALHPVRMSGPMEMDPRLQEFARFTAIAAGNILTDQGYLTNGKGAYFESMWCQEHHRSSDMTQHTHPEALMVGFYFFDVPFGSSAAAFFDPRPGKVATPLAEANKAEITDASNQFYMTPRPGLLLLTNSWLPHAFTRHDGETPLRFVHFNIGLAEHVERDLPEVI